MIQHKTINLDYDCSSLAWVGDSLIDWTSDRVYYDPSGKAKFPNTYSVGQRFTGVASINEGEYVVAYEKLGTKGLVLKNGQLIREINRSYYQSDVYEYPIALMKDASGQVLLIHCPEEYNRLEIEVLETGLCLTKSEDRETVDIFHSRLQASADGKYLLGAGWVWHPFDVFEVFDLEKAIADPSSLDEHKAGPNIDGEVSSARFIDNERIAITTVFDDAEDELKEDTLPPGHIGIYHVVEEELERILKFQEPIGNIFPIDAQTAWDFFSYPKVVDLQTGNILAKLPEINSGKQFSSIIHYLQLPYLALSSDRKKVAISNGKHIEILEWVADE